MTSYSINIHTKQFTISKLCKLTLVNVGIHLHSMDDITLGL